MKIKSSKVLKSLIAVILAVLMIVGTTFNGFARIIDKSVTTAETTHTVYILPSSLGGVSGYTDSTTGVLNSGYTLKVNVNIGDSGTFWSYNASLVDNVTVGGKAVYKATIKVKYGGYDACQFQVYNGSEWKIQYVHNGWVNSDAFNGKIFDTSSWKTYQPDEFYLRWNDGSKSYKMTIQDDLTYKCSVSLSNSINLGSGGLYIYATNWNDKYWKCNDTLNKNKTSFTLSSTQDNFGINVEWSGTYDFYFNPRDKVVSVVYPPGKYYIAYNFDDAVWKESAVFDAINSEVQIEINNAGYYTRNNDEGFMVRRNDGQWISGNDGVMFDGDTPAATAEWDFYDNQGICGFHAIYPGTYRFKLTGITESNNKGPKVKVYRPLKVKFMNGSTIYDDSIVTNGDTVSKPADPTKPGCSFKGWSTSSSTYTAVNFNTAITEDKTYYAWFDELTKYDIVTDPHCEGFTPVSKKGYKGEKISITLTMDKSTSYLDWNNTQIVDENGTNLLPTISPSSTGNTIKFTMPEKKVIIKPALKTKYKMTYELVKFDWSTESGTIADLKINNSTTNNILIDEGNNATFSEAIKSGYTTYYEFIGWYSDKECTKLVDANSSYTFTPTKDTKLYAGFVRNIYLQAWYGASSTIFSTMPKMKFDTAKNRYYYEIPYETGKTTNLRFKYFNKAEVKESEDTCWSEYAWTRSDKFVGLASGSDRGSNNPYHDDFYIKGLQTSYSSPVTVYYDLAKYTYQGSTRNTIYAQAKYVGAKIYLSSGVNMHGAPGQGTAAGSGTVSTTSGFSNSVYVSPTGTGISQGTMIGIQNDANGNVNEKITPITQNVAKDITVKTTILSATDQAKYKVSYFVYYHSDTMTVGKVAASAGDNAGEYIGEGIPVSGSTYVTPIFEEKDANSYLYFNAAEIGAGSDWGPLVAAYGYIGDTTKLDGEWPGQLMIPSDDGKTFYIKTKPAEGTNYIFSNYLNNSAFKYNSKYYDGSKEVAINTHSSPCMNDLGLSGKELVQTYDYNQYQVLSENDYDAILFKLKLNHDDYHGVHKLSGETYTGYTTFKVQENTNLNMALNWGFDYLLTEDNSSHMSFKGQPTEKSAGYYVVSQGDNDISGIGKYATYWYIYDSEGKYITKVNSNAMYSNVDKTAGTNALINALANAGYAYNDEAVMISYEAINRGASGTQPSYDGQWYGKTTVDTYTVDIKIGTMDENQKISILSDSASASIATGVLFYDGYTPAIGNPIPPVDESENAKEIDICAGNSTFHVKSTKANNSYEFVGYYFYDGTSYTKVSKDNSMRTDLQSMSAVTVVSVFELSSYGTGKIEYKYVDRFGKNKTYTYTYRLSEPERNGYDGNNNTPKSVTNLIHYFYSDNTESWGYSPETGKTVINFEDFITKHAPTEKQVDVYQSEISWSRDVCGDPLPGQTITYTANQGGETYQLILNYGNNVTETFEGTNGTLVNATASKFTSGKTFAYWAADADGKSKLTNIKDFKMTIVPTSDRHDPFVAYAIYTEDKKTPDSQSPCIDAMLKYREIEGQSTDPEDTVYTDTYLRFSNQDAKAIIPNDQIVAKFGVVYVSNKKYSTLDDGGKLKREIAYPSDVANIATYVKYSAYQGKAMASGDYYFDVKSFNTSDMSSSPLTIYNRMNHVMAWDYNTRKANSYSAYAFIITKNASGYTDVIISSATDGYFYVGQ